MTFRLQRLEGPAVAKACPGGLSRRFARNRIRVAG
jgi:hypothetical protein